ncbi:AAA family ATPase [Amycolatopsis sp. NPDC059657]|uniref:AAA family ATPase n=1 Tax=Amycolatopsis sp. NPDC059657 TaxID=3346899 RepID=UPI00366E5CA8
MFTERGSFIGRKAEIAALDEITGNPALMVVRGDAGTGKTAFLDVAESNLQARGFDVVRIRCAADLPRWDLFCGALVVAAFRSEFHELGNSRVAAAMAAVSRLCRPATYRSAQPRSRLLSELERLFGCLATGRVAVLIDDAHAAPDPALVVTAAYRAGCVIVATCREDGVTAEPSALSALADRVLDLGPLSETEIDELLADAACGVPLDEAVAPALGSALGSLAGNPGAVLGMFTALRRSGRVVRVQDHLCLAHSNRPVALPPENHLVRLVADLGEPAGHLLAVVGGADGFRLDDLRFFAAAVGQDLDTCGRVVDYLVAAGALDCDKWGVLGTPCPALVAAMDPVEVPGVHRAIAEYLLRDGAEPPDPATLADHIALAGTAMPADPSLVALLETGADGSLSTDPELAARWYRAALHHCVPGGTDHARVLTVLQRLLVRIGHYRCLGEVVAEAVSTGFAGHQRRELAASAALAAIYTTVPVPGPVYDAVGRDAECLAPLDFCSRWFTSGELGSVSELTAAFAVLRGDDFPAEAAEVASDWHDVSHMFQLVLGQGHGKPVTGPLAAYARLRQCYLKGEWNEIPSYARALELTTPVHPAIHPLARLLAAEVLARQGDVKRAAQWLSLAGPQSPHPASHACVEIDIVTRLGEPDRARALGWAAYERISGEDQLGLPWLLVRLAYLELIAGDSAKLRRLCAETKQLHARFGGTQFRAAELVLRGMVERDHAAAVESIEIMRRQGALTDLVCGCVVVALLADDPRPWFHEAYGIARSLGDDWLRLTIKSFMATSGLTPPRYRARHVEMSTVEETIITLIQRGQTNRQIAASILVSEKTVENHLTRLFAKTGCRSRLDLATASLEGRLVLAGYARAGSA